MIYLHKKIIRSPLYKKKVKYKWYLLTKFSLPSIIYTNKNNYEF